MRLPIRHMTVRPLQFTNHLRSTRPACTTSVDKSALTVPKKVDVDRYHALNEFPGLFRRYSQTKSCVLRILWKRQVSIRAWQCTPQDPCSTPSQFPVFRPESAGAVSLAGGRPTQFTRGCRMPSLSYSCRKRKANSITRKSTQCERDSF